MSESLSALLLAAGADREGESRGLGISTIAFKVSAPTPSDPLILENTFLAKGGPARHLHYDQDEWFYVLEGEMRLFLQKPKQEVRLKPGETFVAAAGRPHLVTNAGKTSLTFLVLQGMGEYDYVPLV